MFPVKKKSQILPPGADLGRKIKVAGLVGERFLEKIQNGGRRIHTRRTRSVSAEEGHSTILLAHYIFWF